MLCEELRSVDSRVTFLCLWNSAACYLVSCFNFRPTGVFDAWLLAFHRVQKPCHTRTTEQQAGILNLTGCLAGDRGIDSTSLNLPVSLLSPRDIGHVY
jgi:hypothetical protein